MKFNITFRIRGPAGTVSAPNNTNPVEAVSLAALLGFLALSLPTNPSLGVETVGVIVTPTEESPEDQRAVNCHAELLAACKALDKLDWCAGYEMVQHEELQQALDLARAALAKATGVSP